MAEGVEGLYGVPEPMLPFTICNGFQPPVTFSILQYKCKILAVLQYKAQTDIFQKMLKPVTKYC